MIRADAQRPVETPDKGAARAFTQVVAEAATALVVVDDRANIVEVNGAAERLFGYERNALVGLPIVTLVPHSSRRVHERNTDRFVAQQAPEYLESRDVSGLHRDGTVMPLDLMLYSFTEDGNRYVIAGLVDLASRNSADEALQRLNGLFTEAQEDGKPLTPKEFASHLAEAQEHVRQGGEALGIELHQRAQFLLAFLADRESRDARRLNQLFDRVPIALWEADYSALDPWFAERRAEGVEDLSEYFATHPEAFTAVSERLKILAVNQAALALMPDDPPGSVDHLRISEIRRRATIDRLAAFYGGASETEVTVSGAKVDVLVAAWAGRTPLGDLDLSSVFSTAIDLSEFRSAEARRSDDLVRFETVFDNAAAGITIVDTDARTIVNANQAYTRMLGYGPGELDGVPLSDVTPAAFRENIPDYLAPSSDAANEPTAFERPYLTKSGGIVWGRVSISVVEASAAHPNFRVGVITNVTAVREERDERERAEAVLERRNAELQAFAWTAAHDLTEPLRKIRTFGERLEDRAGDDLDEKSLDYLSRMSSAAERMQALIDGLLDYSRVATQGRAFQWVDVNEVAAGVVADLEVAIAEIGATVEVGDLPRVMGDSTQIRQLLQNLVSNSLKFRSSERLPVVRIGSITSRSESGFVVTDNGVGFASENTTRIFGLFERLHGRDQAGGQGMGLAIAQRIVDRHGGTIIADAVPGRGATFVVRFPLPNGRKANENSGD